MAGAGSVGTLHYHLVRCPKYRRPVLHDAVAVRLAELLREKAGTLAVDVEGLEMMPDQAHLFVSAPPILAPQLLANQFKGYTSRNLRGEFPPLKGRLPSLRGRSYYVGSAGHVSAETIQRYITDQRRS